MTRYGYGRVSRAKQDVEKQRQQLIDQGCDEVILEIGSGKNDKRKEFNKLLARLEAGDSVVVRHVDRMSRRALTLLQIRDRFEQQKVTLIADGKIYDFSNYSDRMLFGFQAVMAEHEADINGERVKAAIAARKTGYKNVGRPSALSPRKKLEVYRAIENRTSKSALAERYDVARSTITKAYEEVKAKKEGEQS